MFAEVLKYKRLTGAGTQSVFEPLAQDIGPARCADRAPRSPLEPGRARPFSRTYAQRVRRALSLFLGTFFPETKVVGRDFGSPFTSPPRGASGSAPEPASTRCRAPSARRGQRLRPRPRSHHFWPRSYPTAQLSPPNVPEKCRRLRRSPSEGCADPGRGRGRPISLFTGSQRDMP